MVFDIRRQDVRQMPTTRNTTVHARILCNTCQHHKDFTEGLPDDLETLSEKAVCGKCQGRVGWIDVYVIESDLPKPVKQEKRCKVCGCVIPEDFLAINRFTTHCYEHLQHNPPVVPRVDEPLGRRSDFEKDSAASRSDAFFGNNHTF